jgi:hypothetical protein
MKTSAAKTGQDESLASLSERGGGLRPIEKIAFTIEKIAFTIEKIIIVSRALLLSFLFMPHSVMRIVEYHI